MSNPVRRRRILAFVTAFVAGLVAIPVAIFFGGWARVAHGDGAPAVASTSTSTLSTSSTTSTTLPPAERYHVAGIGDVALGAVAGRRSGSPTSR
jgi:hypothetical protein